MNNFFSKKVGGGNENINGSMGVDVSNTGVKVDGPSFNAKSSNGWGAYLSTMGGMLGGTKNEQGTTELGCQFNLMGTGVTYDGKDRSGRFGVGLGTGGGVRMHDDGEKQGFGVDVGPFSMDYKSKTFGNTVDKMSKNLDMGWKY
jgi:hypothetical protein